jgi:hypothetical protein
MVMVYPMLMGYGIRLKAQMPSAMTQLNQKIRMEMDTETMQAAICLMLALRNSGILGRMVLWVARTLIKMVGLTYKILIQTISRSGPMLMEMDTVTTQAEPHQMPALAQVGIRRKATAMDASILTETAGMTLLTSYRT